MENIDIEISVMKNNSSWSYSIFEDSFDDPEDLISRLSFYKSSKLEMSFLFSFSFESHFEEFVFTKEYVKINKMLKDIECLEISSFQVIERKLVLIGLDEDFEEIKKTLKDDRKALLKKFEDDK